MHRDVLGDPVVALSSVVVAPGGFPALTGVDLQVQSGELVALRGANGTGKTTLLRLCAGLVPLTRGSGRILGVDLANDRASVRANVGVLGHQNGLYSDLSAYENVKFAATLVGASAADVDSALTRMGVDSQVAARRTRVLSAGQRRRTALASLVVRRAKLWLLDEPHAGLDRTAREDLDHLLLEATRAGATVIFTTHEEIHERSASRAVPRTLTMAGGTIVDDRPATMARS